MATTMRPMSADDQLRRVLRDVRLRWRLRLALRGAAVVAAVALAATLLAAAGVDRLQFDAGFRLGARVAVYVVVAAVAVWALLLPLLRQAPDRRVALYLEEHEPTLDAAVLSAVEHGTDARAAARSPFAGRLAEVAVQRAHTVDDGRNVERRPLRASALALAGVVAAAAVLLLLGPDPVRRTARLLFLPTPASAAPTARFIAVEPGDAELARGGDQVVRAALNGFASDSVVLVLRTLDSAGAPAADWDRLPMSADSAGRFVLRLFDVAAPTEYYVESDGIRSPTYRLRVTDLPFVERISLEYRYPAYTGLPTDSVADGGDIVAPLGTEVRLRATTTLPVRGGRLVVEGRDTVVLTPQPDGTLAGTLRVQRPGFYRVELESVDGRLVPGSLDYTIDVLDDRPPTVSIGKPGRDARPTALEEVFAEARAEDDYGIAKLELVYSVNGGPERIVPLHAGRPLREVTAGHTFFLEEFGLQPGDLVSYYARATDANRATRPQSATTDIYFLQIRPFGRDYRAAEQQGGGGGGGGGQESPGELSQRQREVVAATFNVLRDRQRPGADERALRQNVSTVNLAQGRVRQQAEALNQRLVERGLRADSTLAAVAAELPQAIAAMQQAEEALAARDPQRALPAEQRALQHLQRAEAAFRETQVSRGEGGGGGGGGGEQRSAEELADLFELENDKLRNQYETVERGQQEQAQREVDETMERLRELARRQQQENERMQQLAQRLQSQSGGAGSGGGAQRRLADETEEQARRLERLAREQQSPALQEAARAAREAADAMRRSAAGGSPQQGAGAGAAAAERLQQAQRRLDENRQQGLAGSMQDVQRRAEAAAQRQRELARDAERLGSAAGAEREQRGQQLQEGKNALAEQVRDLEARIAAAGRQARAEQPEAARRLQDAAAGIRQQRLPEKIEFSGEIARRGAPEYARNLDDQIGAELDELRQRVSEAAGAVRAQEGGQRESRSLARARELARALESMQARGAEQGGQGQEGQRGLGQQPGQGQQGEQGQQGQSGQGERGQQGQQGQGQQGQGGQQGQAGQGQQGQQGQGQGQGRGQQRGLGQAQGQQGQGGQQGQQGQQGQGGRQGSEPELGGAPGQPNPNGTMQPGGFGQGGGAPRRFGADEARQLAREARERREEVEALRRELARAGQDVRDLDRVLQGLRALEAQRAYDDPEEVRRLQAAVSEGFKAFEFALRRALEGEDPNRPLLGRAAEAPEAYRKLVEEYYRSLARPQPRR